MSDERLDDETVERLVKQHDQMVAEIQQLLGELELARRLYREPGTENRRRGATAALAYVVNYLRGMGVERPLLAPLREIWAALESADMGLRHPLTEKAEFRGGTKTRPDDAVIRGAAAAAVEILTWADESIPRACDKVGRAADIKASALEALRENLKDGAASRVPSQTRRAYEACITASEASGLPLNEQANLALEHLREMRGKTA